MIKGYRRSSTIYLCMHLQMHIPDSLVSPDAAFRAYTNKSLNKRDNAIIISLLLHLKHMLSDIKSYFWQEKTIARMLFFLFVSITKLYMYRLCL